ncbi:carboxy terminal-processing peptidase [Mucilaginibacter psychrotolerans]|uniref:Tail-specific protease n=1 Tax=Mucilaginibacter psychrotolerans TaxID=1524096 RepID=A0A4Y8SII1_9SPHI|nr:carboxy terminal-processing peptidase [Mucilaginibacter psychrotolerans]TFF38491.1 tail-specific protease [Mucilaginibacter psychrotolerans]
MFKKMGLGAVVCLSILFNNVAFSTVKTYPTGDIQPGKNESEICRLAVKMLMTNNYKKVPLNDSLSVLVFNLYLKSLDENHSYLLAGDVASFEQYRTLLDDDLQNGNLSHVFGMFNTYKMRYEQRLKYAIAQLNADFDFTKKDVYISDRRKKPFINTEAEMDAMWNKRVKYDLLGLQLGNSSIAKNKENLKKKYQSLLNQSDKASSQDVFQLFMNAFTASVDPHAAYFNPFNASQFSVGVTRALEGIGATLILENEYVTIKGLTAGGPAYKTKMINTGDRIIGIAQGKDGQFQDVTGWRLDNAIALIRGPKGTVVKLKVLAKGRSDSEEPQIIEVVRDKIILDDQSAKEEIRTYKANGKDVKIGVIVIPAFYLDYNAYEAGDHNYKSTTRDVKLLLDTLKQKKVDGIMIDLRGNGGGSLNEAISLTGLFISSGPVVQIREVNEHIKVNSDIDTSTYYGGPLAVLVDRTSASASEIFSAAIQDYGRGLILGSQTYGKGSVQTQIDLNKVAMKLAAQNGADEEDEAPIQFGQLNVTIGKFYRINGSSTQHKGVTPDIQLPSYIAPSKYGEDNEPSAMPWDTIGKSEYTKVGSFNRVLPVLTNLYRKRNQTNVAYEAYNNLVKAYQENEKPKPFSLNEDEFKRTRDSNTQKALDRDNKLRVAIGFTALKKGEVKSQTDDLDFMKTEAGQILTDFILLNNTTTGI